MMTPIFLFGTDHVYQTGGYSKNKSCTDEQKKTFAEEVRNICKSKDIKRIAEEMTADGRKKYSVNETIAQGIARESNMYHHEVDLTECERMILSITDCTVPNARPAFPSQDGGQLLGQKFSAMSYEVRERVWAARIMSFQSSKIIWPVLFILGANHVIAFQKIWRCLGGNIKVIHEDYQP